MLSWKTQRYICDKKLRHNLQIFLRPLINYGDTIYDQPQNESFRKKLEFVQYKAALIITNVIQGTYVIRSIKN